jgi:hypothetical protein
MVEMVMIVKASGPLFDGRALRELDKFTIAASAAIAKNGALLVHKNLSQSLRAPTGFYQSNVVVERREEGDMVTDRGVVYGPWLEGVGSKNQSTRFKGYASFRRAQQELQGRVATIAQLEVYPFLGRMNA